MGDWKAGIYQKTPRISLEFWYGNETTEGLKKEKVREEIENWNQGQSRMMPKPVMTEEDLIRLVKTQRNG